MNEISRGCDTMIHLKPQKLCQINDESCNNLETGCNNCLTYINAQKCEQCGDVLILDENSMCSICGLQYKEESE